MEIMTINSPTETDPAWTDRELDLRSKLRRLRFGAEPLGVQVERYRLVTIALTCVAAGIATIFVFIFTAFHRPDIAGIIIGVFFVPIVGLAWFDFTTLRRRVEEYEAERKKAVLPGQESPG